MEDGKKGKKVKAPAGVSARLPPRGHLGNRRHQQMCGSAVKKLPAVQETQVPSLGQEDPLEKEMANHCSIPARRIPRTEEPGRLQTMGSQESDMTKQLNHHHRHTHFCWVQAKW